MTTGMTEFLTACDWLARTNADAAEHIRRLGLELAEAAKAAARKEMMQ